MGDASRDIARQRLACQGLSDPRFASPEDALSWLVAVQSQEHGVAPWSLGERCSGSRESDVRAALERGTIIRTHVLRPTWHYVRDVDARWLIGLSAPRVQAMNRRVEKTFEVDAELLARCCKWIARELEGGNHLTRAELAEKVAERGVSASGTRLAYIFMFAELERLICSGAPRISATGASTHTYALFDERVPLGGDMDEEEALATLTRRFFTSRGPATIKDFCTWASFTQATVRRGLEAVGDALVSMERDGRTWWLAPSAPAGSVDSAHFLQGYDEYFASYPDSRYVHAPAKRVAEPPRVATLHAIIDDGQGIGRWRRKPQRGRATLEAHLFARPTKARRRALEAAAERYGDFLGVPVDLDVHVGT